MAFHRIQDPDRLHALIDAILLIETDANLSTLLSRIVETATKLVGARYGALGVLASDRETLSRFVTFGLNHDQETAIGDRPHGKGVLGETIRLAHALRIDDLSAHPSSAGFPANHPKMERFLGVPVITGNGRIYGNLYLTDPVSGDEFSESDQHLVEAFGRAAGIVIDQALLRSHMRELTLTEERERLARDLHDTVVQRLFGVGLALQMTLSGTIEDSVRERINKSLDELDETIREIRTTIFEIDQEHPGSESMRARIMVLIDEVRTRLGVDVQLKMEPELEFEIGPHCAQHALQALREILSNIVRHSEASVVHVKVDVHDKLLVLSVADNGVGFVSATGAGRGLRNLDSRARELGGECEIISEIGRGTLVRWTANRLD
jgi:signal transduction histidine kinase